jgi:hypothetical protein
VQKHLLLFVLFPKKHFHTFSAQISPSKDSGDIFINGKNEVINDTPAFNIGLQILILWDVTPYSLVVLKHADEAFYLLKHVCIFVRDVTDMLFEYCIKNPRVTSGRSDPKTGE